jgi:hypothetical protein
MNVMKNISWELGKWYTIVYNDDSTITFKLLNSSTDGRGTFNVEFCSGEKDNIQISMYKKIIPHGEQSPCK